MANGWTFAQLCNYVYIETARPDMEAETQSAVLASTLKMHGLDFFPRDRVHALTIFDSVAYIQQLDLSALPRFRAFHYIRKWDPNFASSQTTPTLLPPLQINNFGLPYNEQLALGFITIIDPDDILDQQYNSERVDVGFLAGSTLYVKSSTQFQQAFIGWYQYPNLDIQNGMVGYSSWIADNHPFAIIYDAASAILQKIGMTDAARKYDDPNVGLVAQQINGLRISATTALGR